MFPLPSQADAESLIPKNTGKGPVTSTELIRKVVQNCFDHSIAKFKQDGFIEGVESLTAATVHWLRHTEISD